MLIVFKVFLKITMFNYYRDVLAKNDYVKIHSVRLVGILLSLFAKRKHLMSVRNVETSYTRTGLNGLWVTKTCSKNKITLF